MTLIPDNMQILYNHGDFLLYFSKTCSCFYVRTEPLPATEAVERNCTHTKNPKNTKGQTVQQNAAQPPSLEDVQETRSFPEEVIIVFALKKLHEYILCLKLTTFLRPCSWQGKVQVLSTRFFATLKSHKHRCVPFANPERNERWLVFKF